MAADQAGRRRLGVPACLGCDVARRHQDRGAGRLPGRPHHRRHLDGLRGRREAGRRGRQGLSRGVGFPARHRFRRSARSSRRRSWTRAGATSRTSRASGRSTTMPASSRRSSMPKCSTPVISEVRQPAAHHGGRTLVDRASRSHGRADRGTWRHRPDQPEQDHGGRSRGQPRGQDPAMGRHGLARQDGLAERRSRALPRCDLRQGGRLCGKEKNLPTSRRRRRN